MATDQRDHLDAGVGSTPAALCRDIARVLHRHDPMGMRAGRFAAEYEPEAIGIVLSLPRVRSLADLAEATRDAFARWSDPLLAGPAERYAEVARDIWHCWRGRPRALALRTRRQRRPRAA